jgi:hypothetical protein
VPITVHPLQLQAGNLMSAMVVPGQFDPDRTRPPYTGQAIATMIAA